MAIQAGTWSDLRSTVGRKYAEALGRDMPWFNMGCCLLLSRKH